MRSVQEDREASLADLRLPAVHRKHIRGTNLVGRSFEGERRRAKVIPRCRSERECLKLGLAVLWRASERWRRVQFSEHERKQLQRYMEERQRQREQKGASAAATVA